MKQLTCLAYGLCVTEGKWLQWVFGPYPDDGPIANRLIHISPDWLKGETWE